jgi:hypothetical protein
MAEFESLEKGLGESRWELPVALQRSDSLMVRQASHNKGVRFVGGCIKTKCEASSVIG